MFDHIDYVCPKCFNKVGDCTCDSKPYYLVEIDANMQKHIRILNEKGYTTKFCCESHNCNDAIYIMFSQRHEFDIVPDGFTYKEKDSVMRHEYYRGISHDKFVDDKERRLQSLLEWCEELPYIK